jgi:RNA polymerase sigma factor (TIGR02999 family)
VTSFLPLPEADADQETHAPPAYGTLYQELRQIAHSRLRCSADFTLLNTTALVHESYLRFLQTEGLSFDDRRRFLAYASQVMRSVVVDFVRQRQSERRGGEHVAVTLNSAIADVVPQPEAEVLGVHAALEELEKAEPRLAQVVEMRYFAGLTEAEIAKSMGVTERTVRRDWDKARLLLRVALG